jgi:sterol desaturase/sphingolipid hydroxylase (fatty acid hydroxylase superfamily)
MDWLAGSRMHLLEIVVLRGCTLVPMYVLGFSDPALYGYIFAVYLFSTLVHANLRTGFGWLERWLVTPRFHHWHHGIEPEAIDVNFAVHFPWLDRIFGTYHLPEDGRWPSGYGIKGEMPPGFLRQHLYPFVRRRVKSFEAEDLQHRDE